MHFPSNRRNPLLSKLLTAFLTVGRLSFAPRTLTNRSGGRAMSALEVLKRHAHCAGLLLLSAVIGAVAFFMPSRISMMELERESFVAAERLNNQLMQEPGTLLDALSQPALAPQLSSIFEHSGYGARVLRYELYDEAGRLVFTSGK